MKNDTLNTVVLLEDKSAESVYTKEASFASYSAGARYLDRGEITGERIKNYLGLAQKAGKIAAGDQAVLNLIAKGKACLIVMAEDISAKINAQLRQAFAQNGENIPVIVWGNKKDLGSAIGKSPRGMIAFSDIGFAKAVLKLFKD
jgi:ribosomal protein L7Ae-like RNA K-turn-binding protein